MNLLSKEEIYLLLKLVVIFAFFLFGFLLFWDLIEYFAQKIIIGTDEFSSPLPESGILHRLDIKFGLYLALIPILYFVNQYFLKLKDWRNVFYYAFLIVLFTVSAFQLRIKTTNNVISKAMIKYPNVDVGYNKYNTKVEDFILGGILLAGIIFYITYKFILQKKRLKNAKS